MTDYQAVSVLDVEDLVVTVDVREFIDSGRALEAVLAGGGDDDPVDTIKIAAMLLLDEKGRAGAIRPVSEAAAPQPTDFVSAVRVVTVGWVGDDRRAVLAITMTNARYTAQFEVGDTFGAVADPYGDFADCFG